MGWLFLHSVRTKPQMLARLNSSEHLGEHYRLIDTSLRGNRLWQLVEMLPTHPSYGALPSPFIALSLLGYDRSLGCWGYKSLSEDMGPCEVDCPLKFLAAAPVFGNHGPEWRERVRAHHTALRARPKLEPGMEIEINKTRFVLKENRGRRGWHIRQIDTGETFRASCRTVRQGRIPATTAARA